jgi:hypothetical protein
LYEDEGNTNFYLDGAYAITPMRQDWSEKKTTITIGPAEGAVNLLPPNRQVDLYFRGFNIPEEITVWINGSPVETTSFYRAETHTFQISGIQIAPSDIVKITLASKEKQGLADRSDARINQVLKMVKYFKMGNNAKEDLAAALPGLLDNPGGFGRFLPALTDGQLKALLEIATGAGVDFSRTTGEPLIVLWNRNEDDQVTYQSALSREHHWWHYSDRRPWTSGVLPRFMAIRPKVDFGEGNPWKILVNYFGILNEKVES